MLEATLTFSPPNVTLRDKDTMQVVLTCSSSISQTREFRITRVSNNDLLAEANIDIQGGAPQVSATDN